MIRSFSAVPKVFVKAGPSIDIPPRSLFVDGKKSPPGREDPESFHSTLTPFLKIAKFLGLFPVSGVDSRNPKLMNFKMKSFWSFYAFQLFIVTVLSGLFRIAIGSNTSKDLFSAIGTSPKTATIVCYFVSTLLARGIFFWLSSKWVKLQQEWESVEDQINSLNRDGSRFRSKFNAVLFILIFLIITDRIGLIITTVEENKSVSKSFLEVFIEINFRKQSAVFDYSKNLAVVEGTVYLIISFFTSSTLFFMDFFIILVSMRLAYNYKRLNKSAADSVSQRRCSVHWLQLREKYSALHNLVKHTDECISPLILLSFATNIYFICFQFSAGFSAGKMDSPAATYHFTKFLILIGRIAAITLSASDINEQSKKTLPVLYCCPASRFTKEAERLQLQLSTDEVALTGMNFFSITRKFMLAIAGSLVTYEVILLQLVRAKTE